MSVRVQLDKTARSIFFVNLPGLTANSFLTRELKYRVEQVMWPHFAWSVRAPRVSPDDLVVSSAKLRPSTFIFTVLESFSLKNGVIK